MVEREKDRYERLRAAGLSLGEKGPTARELAGIMATLSDALHGDVEMLSHAVADLEHWRETQRGHH